MKALLALCLLSWSGWVTAQQYWKINLEGAIGPGVSAYVVEQIAQAQAARPAFVLLQIDTPGGLVASMREINQAILASQIPVVGYVHPAGARAASAGTYILYACHLAAMTPATHLGAATPVQLIGSPSKDKGDEPDPNQQALHNKQLNDAVASIRALAELRGRNAEWAERAVTEGATLTAEQAFERGVINILAASEGELLAQLDGLTLSLPQGSVTLETAALQAVERQPDWRQQFIQTLSNPNIAYILMMIGIYGLLLEFYSPGIGVAGISGGICLLLALYALQMLPVNYAGAALLLLGIALLTAEAFSPSFGVLGLGGITALSLGSIMLFDSPDGAFAIAWPLIAAVALTAAILSLVVVRMLLANRHQPLTAGADAMCGQLAIASDAFTEHGRVKFDGELWQAHSRHPLTKGQAVRIEQVHNLVLEVSPLEPTRSDKE